MSSGKGASAASETTGSAAHPPLAEQTLTGWGQMLPQQCVTMRPESLRSAIHALQHAPTHTVISRGLGRSYGDSAVNAGGSVILHERLNRLIALDRDSGVLTCEAGVSIETLLDYLLPQAWFPPVTPGTKFVTIGGAIAADVHGKNHHAEGSIGHFVQSFELLLPSGETLHCSREENADVFWATLGGMGLTGVILSASIQMLPVSSAYFDVRYRRTRNLTELLDAFEQTGERGRYCVAWIDCIAGGNSLGRSVLMDGEHADAGQLPRALKSQPLSIKPKPKKSVPINFPQLALNRLSVKLFNRFYYGSHADEQKFVDYDSFFYPLDAVHHWYRVYGKRGFVQYQALLPPESSRVGMKALLKRISDAGMASFLAVLKRMGPGNQGLLSFPHEGDTLALDLPNRGDALTKLLGELDAIVLDHGGRLYMAKDTMMSAESFAKMYPRLPEFLAIKRRLDPEQRLASDQSRRLGITPVGNHGGASRRQ